MTIHRKLFDFYNEHCDGHFAKESDIVEKGDTLIKGNIQEPNGQTNCYICMCFKPDKSETIVSVQIYEGEWEEFIDKEDDELIYDKMFKVDNDFI